MGSIRERKNKNGSVYEAIVRVKGHPEYRTTHQTKTEAKDWIQDTEVRLKKGGLVERKSTASVSISDVLNEYLIDHQKKDGNGDVVQDEKGKPVYVGISSKKAMNIGVLILHLGEYNLNTLTHKIIAKFIERMLDSDVPPPINKKKTHKDYNGGIPKKYAPATVRRYYYDLKLAMEYWAFKHKFNLGDRFTNQNVPAGWEGQRSRRLEGDEEERLLNACLRMTKAPRQWQLIIEWGIATGMRASETLQIEWNDCYLEKRYVNVRDTTNKTKLSRNVPLTGKALEIMKELWNASESKEGRVFHLIPHAEFSAGFKKIANAAKVKNFIYHDLRHEALSRFYEHTDLTDNEIALIAGHTQLETLRRYLVLRPALLAERLDAAFAKRKTKESNEVQSI